MDGKLLQQLKNLRDEQDFKKQRALSRQMAEAISEVRPELLQVLREEQDKGLKIEALNIIAASQDQSFVPTVQQIILLADEPVEVLQTAATVLGKLRSGSSLETLAGLLKHESSNVRLGSIYGLIALGDKRAVPYLMNSLDDKDQVRCWWPSPKAGGYTIAQEASIAIDALTGLSLRGDRGKITQWIDDNLR